MSAKIITLDTLIETRKANSKRAVAPVFAGSMDSAAASTEAPVEIVRSNKETAEVRDTLENMRHELQGKIKQNAAYVPSSMSGSACSLCPSSQAMNAQRTEGSRSTVASSPLRRPGMASSAV